MSPSLRGHEAALGAVRARFRMHWPWYIWSVVWVLPFVVAAVIAVMGSPGAAVALLVFLLIVMALPLTWFLRRHQVLLTDRAVVYGTFVPRVSPEVVHFADIDLATVRTWSNLRAYLRSAQQSSFSSGHLITEGSRTGVTFLARRAGTYRAGRLEEDPFVARQGGTIVMFALSGSAQRFISALSQQMVAAGIRDAQHLPGTALPPGRLTGRRGAHRAEIPGYPAPSSERFEDLPPQLQERIRRHTIGD